MKNKIGSILILLSLTPALAFADEFGAGGWGHRMGYGWGGHMGFMGGGWLMMALWIGLILFAVIGIARWAFGPKKKVVATNDVQNILSTRFAQGEISKEQYEEMKKLLL